MSGEDLLLKWNDHHSLFFSGAEELCQSEEYTDVTLSAGSKLFPCHRLVLSVCSPYFRQLFRRLGNDKSVIYLKDVEPRHLELLLDYMYRGEIRVEEQELGTVLNTAQGLEIRGLTESGKRSHDNTESSGQSEPIRDIVTQTPPPPSVTYDENYENLQKINVSKSNKKRKLVTPIENSDTHFKIGAVDVIPSPALSTTPPLCPIVKQEVGNVGGDVWNNAQSEQQMTAAYDDTEEAYTETNLTSTGYDHEVYEESAVGYYQESGDQNDQEFLMDVRERRGRGRPKKMLYNCHICGKQLRDKYNLDRHISSHYGEKNFKCEYCIPVKLFADQSNLRNHMKSKHPELLIGEKDFSCYHCVPSKLFTDQPSLTKHVKSRHPEELGHFSIKEEANN